MCARACFCFSVYRDQCNEAVDFAAGGCLYLAAVGKVGL